MGLHDKLKNDQLFNLGFDALDTGAKAQVEEWLKDFFSDLEALVASHASPLVMNESKNVTGSLG
jgi:hypothetical protein